MSLFVRLRDDNVFLVKNVADVADFERFVSRSGLDPLHGFVSSCWMVRLFDSDGYPTAVDVFVERHVRLGEVVEVYEYDIGDIVW